MQSHHKPFMLRLFQMMFPVPKVRVVTPARNNLERRIAYEAKRDTLNGERV